MVMHPSIDQTIALAGYLHSGQLDKAGVPYMAHLLAVMRRVPERSRHVALLHDSVEDGHVTLERLFALGYSQEEVDAIDLLTRRPHFDYEPYITRIIESKNAIAIEVKIADLDDNLDLSRLKEITDADRARAEKYRAARQRLTGDVAPHDYHSLMAALCELYSEGDAFMWLISRHPQLDGERPITMLNDGRAHEVYAAIERLQSGAYI